MTPHEEIPVEAFERASQAHTAPAKPEIPAWLAAQLPPAGRPTPGAQRGAGWLIRDPRAWLAGYAVVLMLVAFWPTHVDQGMGPVLQAVTRIIPILTYPRIEFAANVLLFVPLGSLLMLILRQRYLIMPIALSITVSIECVQSLMGPGRTASLHDVVANATGAAAGMLAVAAAGWLVRKRR